MKEEKKILSFVKRNGRKLSKSKQNLFSTLLPKYEITKENDILLNNIISSDKECNMEIGYGGGEHLAFQAMRNKNVNFIGCEPFIQGTAKLLNQISDGNIENIFIYQDNAIDLINNMPDGFLSKLFILFPDPWPKKRHNKRRIINHDNLSLFAKKIKRGGLLRVATDHEDYASWIISMLINDNNFIWKCEHSKKWYDPPKDWYQTKYQKKSLLKGSKNYFFDFIKNT